ncbi:MAG: glycosyl transferase [Acidobacteria bacterium]|nr:MAG: glycosyl transferase [Acidobacteriota bacterium]
MASFLSIVIPAYNEEKRIGRSLDAVLRFLETQNYTADVIVVDDGSSDETARKVSERIQQYSDAGHFSDADLSSPITEAPKLVDPIAEGRADLTFGSRALNRELIGVRQPLIRDFGGRVFNLFMRTITGLRFKDTQCGFKAFRREPALAVFKLQSIERFGFDPEVLYIAKKRGLRLLEVPVVWNDSEGSTVNYVSDSIKMFTDLVRIRFNDLAGRYN